MIDGKIFISVLLTACGVLPVDSVSAAVFFVSPQGDDRASGVAPSAPFRTLSRAVRACSAGDTLRLLPGIYFEPLVIEDKGASRSALRIVAEDPEFGRTVLSGARREIRSRQISWKPFDKESAIFFLESWGGWPARVLADGLDLFPYASLEALTEKTTSAGMGPKEGYFYDEAKNQLFVRLSEERGSLDPNERVMCVAPPTGSGFDGMQITQRSHYNVGILGANNPPVVIEGVTFETPGVAGVYTESSDVTIRCCWFRGCRTAVAGTASGGRAGAERVTIEYCDFSQKPAFRDALESHKTEAGRVLWRRKAKTQGLPDDRLKYEIGLVSNAGKDWVIRRNRVHDAFEGLATRAVSWSTGMKVIENVFDRICDNGIEVEDHSSGMEIRGNLFIDNFEAVSYQPLDGPPWPESIVIEENVVMERVETARKFDEIAADRGAFKIGISLKNWPKGTKPDNLPKSSFRVPGTGLSIRNNAVFLAAGSIFKIIGPTSVPLEQVFIKENVLSAHRLAYGRELPAGHFEFEGNLCITDERMHTDWEIAARKGGEVIVEKLPVVRPDEDKSTFLSLRKANAASITGSMNLLNEVGPQAYPGADKPVR